MSIFGKKWEGEHSGAGRHGIGDVIRLLRALPVDQHPELVVQVIRTTLEALEVAHVSDLIQDAVRQEQKLNERIAALRAQMQELSKQIDTHREETSRLEADLAETTLAKERLVFAEQAAASMAQVPSGLKAPGPLPPPVPPPKSGPPNPLAPTPHNARS
jgi:septal ring factor EnvC (AmiA/AmiB activator)